MSYNGKIDLKTCAISVSWASSKRMEQNRIEENIGTLGDKISRSKNIEEKKKLR
jgi:hypothetical protein